MLKKLRSRRLGTKRSKRSFLIFRSLTLAVLVGVLAVFGLSVKNTLALNWNEPSNNPPSMAGISGPVWAQSAVAQPGDTWLAGKGRYDTAGTGDANCTGAKVCGADNAGLFGLSGESATGVGLYASTGNAASYAGDFNGNVYMYPGSKLGMGIAPSYYLDILANVANGAVANFESSSTSATNTGITLRNSSSVAAARDWALLTNSVAAGDFVIKQSNALSGDPVAAGTTRLYVSPGGQIGIANTAPSALLTLGTAGTTAGSLYLAGATANGITVNVPASVAATYAITLPAAAPTVNGQVLSATTAGVASWTTVGGGSQTPWTSAINAAGYTLFGNSIAGGSLSLESNSTATPGGIYLNWSYPAHTSGLAVSSGTKGVLMMGGDGLPSTSGVPQNTIAQFQMGNNAVGMEIGATSTGAASWIQSVTLNDSVSKMLLLNPNGGNVGIGTATPGSALHVNGGWITVVRSGKTLLLNPNYAGGNAYAQVAALGTDSMGLSLSSKDTNPEYLFIANDGKVGVGTTTPNNKLQVAGLINFDPILDNTFLGIQTGNANTNGNFNTGVGWRNLYSNILGSYNVSIGDVALYSNTGSYNTASGASTLTSNTTGNNNTASGYFSLASNTTGIDNTAVGFWAGYNSGTSLQTMSNSTFLGYGANSSVNGVTNSMALGNGAQITASNQVMIGNGAITQVKIPGLMNIDPAHDNVFLGRGTGIVNSGNGNTAIGALSLMVSSTGSYNTALGLNALSLDTSGSSNTSVGQASLAANTTGANNTALGTNALLVNTTGHENTGLGTIALKTLTTGTGNTAVGNAAGWNNAVTLATISNSTFLGNSANASVDGITNSVAIGYNAQATASNQVVIGNSSVTSNIMYGGLTVGGKGVCLADGTNCPSSSGGASMPDVRYMENTTTCPAGYTTGTVTDGKAHWSSPAGSFIMNNNYYSLGAASGNGYSNVYYMPGWNSSYSTSYVGTVCLKQ